MELVFWLLVFGIVAHKRPLIATGIILALLPSYLIRFNFFGLPTTLLELLLGVFLLVTFFTHLPQIIPAIKSLGKINWAIGAFFLAGLISVFVSPETREALGAFKAFVVEPILFFYSMKIVIKTESDLKTPLNLLFISSILIGILGIIQYYTLINLPMQFWGTGAEVERITSFYEYPNALALYLAPLITFFTAMLFSKEQLVNRKNLIIGLIIMFVGIFLTFSRGAWIAICLTLLLLIFYKFSWKKSLLFCGLILICLFAIPATRNRLILINQDSSSSAHVDLMKAALTKIKQSPITGNGLNGFRNTLTQQRFQGEILNYPHNIILNFWVEMGILGLLSFFVILVLAINNFRLDPKWYRLAAACYLITLATHGLVDVPYFKNDLSVLFFFVISLFYI